MGEVQCFGGGRGSFKFGRFQVVSSWEGFKFLDVKFREVVRFWEGVERSYFGRSGVGQGARREEEGDSEERDVWRF